MSNVRDDYVTNCYKNNPYECWVCGSKRDLQVHHINGRRDLGHHDPENLVPLCQPCHSDVHLTSTTNNRKIRELKMYLSPQAMQFGRSAISVEVDDSIMERYVSEHGQKESTMKMRDILQEQAPGESDE